MRYPDTDNLDFLSHVLTEMCAVASVTGAMFSIETHVGVHPMTVAHTLAVTHWRTWNSREWAIDAESWQDVVRQAKRLLTEWTETERVEAWPTGGGTHAET